MENFEIKLKKNESIKFCDEAGHTISSFANYSVRPAVLKATKFVLSYYITLERKTTLQQYWCASYKIERIPDSLESV